MLAVASGKSMVGCFLEAGIGKPVIKHYPPLPSTVEAVRFDANGNILVAYNGGVTMWDMSRSVEDLQAVDLPYNVCILLMRTNIVGC